MLQTNFTDFFQNFDNLQQDRNQLFVKHIIINISSSFQISIFFFHFNYQVFFTALTQIIDSFQNPALKSEKLSDISKYEENKDKLDTWEQALIQRMHINHDQYFTQSKKIAYTKFHFKIESRTHNLMNHYHENDLCILLTFRIWQKKLHNICENHFEKENTQKYFYNILKQKFSIFNEYYNLFFKKKNVHIFRLVNLIYVRN